MEKRQNIHFAAGLGADGVFMRGEQWGRRGKTYDRNETQLEMFLVTSCDSPACTPFVHIIVRWHQADLRNGLPNSKWNNPHIWFFFDINDENGKVANWAFEGAAPALLIRRE